MLDGWGLQRGGGTAGPCWRRWLHPAVLSLKATLGSCGASADPEGGGRWADPLRLSVESQDVRGLALPPLPPALAQALAARHLGP